MTPSPGPAGPTAGRRWCIAFLLAAVAGGATGAAIDAVTPGRWSGGWSGGSDRGTPAEVETRVEGISVERSSVDAADGSTSSPPATAPTAPPATEPAVEPAVERAVEPPAVAPAAETAPGTEPVAGPDSVRAQVLALISFPWRERLPGWRIEFRPERAGYRGSTFPADRVIQVYLRDGLTIADYVHVTAHEIGHAVDVTLLDDDDHARWNEARGRSADADWWVASGADDFSSGAGDWAESFAWSQLPSGRFYSELGPPPDAGQLAVLADIVG